MGCSVLSVSEVMRLVRDEELPRTEELLDSLIALPVGVSEAKLAAVLMRNREPGFVDCHIAATALLRRVPIVTYNRQDYERTGATVFDTTGW